MLNSNSRKLILSGWLQENGISEYRASLRLQKFLFFYEAFSKVENDVADFSSLKGYRRGPVFSPVWGDYTKDRGEFDEKSRELYQNSPEIVDGVRAQRVHFIVSSLTEDELSQLTHKMNIWKSQERRILSGERQVELHEADFNDRDYALISSLEKMYPTEMVQNSGVINARDKYFVFSNSDIKQLTAQHFDTLDLLSQKDDLHNPVYVSIDEDGRLCVD